VIVDPDPVKVYDVGFVPVPVVTALTLVSDKIPQLVVFVGNTPTEEATLHIYVIKLYVTTLLNLYVVAAE
jgi:hypothetical protein